MTKKKSLISSVSSSLAAYILKKKLEEGKTIEIPSLGIKFNKDGIIEEKKE